MPESIRDTIARVAREEGIDPSYALATAERESRFNPNAGGSGSINGLFQLTGKNRRTYAQDEGASVEDQVRAFTRMTKSVMGEMRGVLGRDPTPDESYLGHHWGGARAANVVAGRNRDLSPQDFFSPRELAGNPHLARGSSVGQLADSITSDIGRRRAKFGGDTNNAGAGTPDFSAFGQQQSDGAAPATAALPQPAPAATVAPAPARATAPLQPPVPAAAMPDMRAAAMPDRQAGLDLLRPPMQQWHNQRLAELAAQGRPQPGPEPVATRPQPAADTIDFSQFGAPESVAHETAQNMRADMRPGQEIDLSQFGVGAKLAMNTEDMPESTRVDDRSGEPEQPISARTMLEMMARERDPYGSQPRFPNSKRRATPMATDAGIQDIGDTPAAFGVQ